MNTRGRIFSLYKGSNKQISLGYNNVLASLSSDKNTEIHRTLKLKPTPQRVTETFSLFLIENNTFEPTVRCYGHSRTTSWVQSTLPNLFSSKSKSYSKWEHQFEFTIPSGMQNRNIIKKESARTFHTLTTSIIKNDITFLNRYESTKTPEKPPELSRKDQLKRAVKEYGSTVIIFHVGISLISLGTCYILVSSGIDLQKLMAPIGVNAGLLANAGTFVTAYAIHKVFAPVRISITLGATPFIVRYLRNIGFLKKPKVK